MLCSTMVAHFSAASSGTRQSHQSVKRYNTQDDGSNRNNEYFAILHRAALMYPHRMSCHKSGCRQRAPLQAIALVAMWLGLYSAAAGQSTDAGARRLRSSSSSEYAKVSVFGVEATGNKFVYVFDRSGSMEGPPLAAAKRQLLESLKALDEIHQFHIIFFNHRLMPFDATGGARRIAFATERNKQLAARFVARVKADGGSNRVDALKQALAFRPDVIFFLSDADGPMTAKEMEEITDLNERVGARICVIEFGRSNTAPQRNFLTELASSSGGEYGYVNAAKLSP